MSLNFQDTAQYIASRQDISTSGATKVDHYKWGVKDAPGTFRMINKNLLSIDPEYQRRLVRERVLGIARDWSWIGCGVLLVASRPDETRYMVMDGQHRKAAADKRTDIEELPCMVFETDEIKAEASGFLIANTLRRPLKMVDKFKALNITEDPAAAVVESLARQSGRIVAAGATANSLTCVAAVMECAQSDEVKLREIWPTIVELCAGHTLPGSIVKGMFWLQGNLEEGHSLNATGRWGRRLVSVGYDRVMACIRQSASFYGMSTPKVIAIGIVKAINSNARVKIPHTIAGMDRA